MTNKPRTIADVTAALRAEGFPVELVKGRGYLYFVFDDGSVYETESILVYAFNQQTPDEWIVDGRRFATGVRKRYGIAA